MPKMTKTKTHKKQHFVPQCYTKAWYDTMAPAGPKMEPYVWMIDRDGSNPRRKAPGNLFTETDIYTIEREDGGRDLRLEHGFQDLEDKFTRIRNLKFKLNLWPDADQMVYLLAFVAAAQFRTASNRDHQRQQWGGIRKRMEDFNAALKKASPENKAKITRVDKVESGSGSARGMTLEDVRALEDNPIQLLIGSTLKVVVPAFQRMNVAVLCTRDPIGFVTSDRPCTWYDPENYKFPPWLRGPGLASPTIEVTLPISPSQCLLISHYPEYQGYIDIPEATLNLLNCRHIVHCEEVFVSRSQQTLPDWFAKSVMPDDAWEKVRERKIASGEWEEHGDHKVR